MSKTIKLTATIPNTQRTQRLDQALAACFPDYSRTRIKQWIINNNVLVDGIKVNIPKAKIFGGESVILDAEIANLHDMTPQSIPLDILFEDEEILIINKPANLVVHPGAGNPDNTLLNALLYHHPDSIMLPRAGIVHRLDKDTTGLMVIAKTLIAYTQLVSAMQQREITREYEAIVVGNVITAGTITAAIKRHPTKRTLMAVHPNGRAACTHYRILQKFRYHTHLRLRLATGRTHQIRVHMTHLKHPIVGDRVYGQHSFFSKTATNALIMAISAFKRQALHAVYLALYHPISKQPMFWQTPLPDDMRYLLNCLIADTHEADSFQ